MSITLVIEKGNPNRDPATGRFDFGQGGNRTNANVGAGSQIAEGKDITNDLGKEYGTTSETKKGQELRVKEMESNYDAVLEDISKKQGFDGKADLVNQEQFDKIVADGGTVTHRGVTNYWDGPGPDAKYIEGDSIEKNFAEGDYFAGRGGYGSGTYTSIDVKTAQEYADRGAKGGSVVTMVVKPGAKIATPEQWQAARTAAREGKGGFMGADNEGRILAAQGFDGFRIASKNVDHFSKDFIVVLNRTAVAVLDK